MIATALSLQNVLAILSEKVNFFKDAFIKTNGLYLTGNNSEHFLWQF